jgi:hypothetical protein
MLSGLLEIVQLLTLSLLRSPHFLSKASVLASLTVNNEPLQRHKQPVSKTYRRVKKVVVGPVDGPKAGPDTTKTSPKHIQNGVLGLRT